MRNILVLVAVIVSLANICQCKDMSLGSTGYRILQEKLEYKAIPLTKRSKDYFFNDPAQRIIKGIFATDLDKSGSSVEIIAGGIGHPFVNLRLKSARSAPLKYLLEIYS